MKAENRKTVFSSSRNGKSIDTKNFLTASKRILIKPEVPLDEIDHFLKSSDIKTSSYWLKANNGKGTCGHQIDKAGGLCLDCGSCGPHCTCTKPRFAPTDELPGCQYCGFYDCSGDCSEGDFIKAHPKKDKA